MTLPAAGSSNVYVGNGSVASYPYGFRTRQASDLTVKVRDLTNNLTTLVLNTDYTVNGLGSLAGGNISLVNAAQPWLTGGGNLLTGFTLIIRRVLLLEQNTSIRDQSDFFADVHEDQFDSEVMQLQQLRDDMSTAVRLSEIDQAAGFNPQLPKNIVGLTYANSVLATNPAGNGWVLSPGLQGPTGPAGPAGPAGSAIEIVVDGGDAPFSILPAQQHVRAGTVLTAIRTWTLPAAVTIGEVHNVNNPSAQTFKIIVTRVGGDLINGQVNCDVNPNQNFEFICGAVGVWDVR